MSLPKYVTLADGTLAQVIHDSDVPIDKAYLLRRADWPTPDPAEWMKWCLHCDRWHPTNFWGREVPESPKIPPE
jgi:hypothetical protein